MERTRKKQWIAGSVLATALLGGLGVAGCGPQEEVPAQGPKPTEQSQPKAPTPVQISAQATPFDPSELALPGMTYTSVQVVVTNTGDRPLDTNPLYFTITASDGTKYDTWAGLGMDSRELSSMSIQPGEKAKGTVTAEGEFRAAKVVFTPPSAANTGYTAEVTP